MDHAEHERIAERIEGACPGWVSKLIEGKVLIVVDDAGHDTLNNKSREFLEVLTRFAIYHGNAVLIGDYRDTLLLRKGP